MVRKASNPQLLSDALEIAMKSLRRSAQTEKQLRDKLTKRQFSTETIESTIKKLIDMTMINDQKYAEDYVSYRTRTVPLGSRYLKLKLIQKGVDAEVAKRAVSIMTTDDELELASSLAGKRLPLLHRFDPEQRKIKLARFLAGRGFSSEIIYKIIEVIDS